MIQPNRRTLLAALGALPLIAAAGPGPAPIVRGVKLGITSASLNPLPADAGADPLAAMLAQAATLGLWCIELSGGFFGPALKDAVVGGQAPANPSPAYLETREALRQWRLSAASLDRFREVKRAFQQANQRLFSLSNTFADDCTDAEIDAMFRQMQMLGVRLFQTNQTRVETGLRLAPFAEKYGIAPAFHTHAAAGDPNEIASVDSLERLLARSRAFRICLDIGHFTAGNQDAVAYLTRRHDRITHIHVKDRRRDNGPNVALGQGDTPIADCLRLIRDNRWPIPVLVEREFKGTATPLQETAANLEYLRAILRD